MFFNVGTTMARLYLKDAGENRVRMVIALRKYLHCSVAEALALLSKLNAVLMESDEETIRQLEGEIRQAGGRAYSFSDYELAHPLHWVQDSISVDKVHCAVCGAKLFAAIPGVTTPAEIRAFATRSSFENRGVIAETAWIHPGIYCENGCCQCLLNFY